MIGKSNFEKLAYQRPTFVFVNPKGLRTKLPQISPQ